VSKKYHARQLELLVPSSPEGLPTLLEVVLSEARKALQMLLMEVVVAERGPQEVRDEQDHT
jgi:hypothetical protein